MKTARRSNAKRRQGIVLILVVSLLALFILLGITFALVASAHLNAARIDRDIDSRGDMPETEVDLVLQQILSETYVRFSSTYRTSLEGHSLLADMYGIDGLTAYVTGASTIYDPAGNGQILSFQAALLQQSEQPFQQTVAWKPTIDYYSGRVLTFMTGQLAGTSTRITHYLPGTPPTIYVEMPKHLTTVAVMPAVNDRFVINGAPFNGAGFGYQVAGNLDLLLNSGNPLLSPNTDYVALLPHFAGYQATSAFISAAGIDNPASLNRSRGGMDESYDAADTQNMHLSVTPSYVALDTTGTVPLFPSYHRPDLLNYWMYKLEGTYGYPDLTNNTNFANIANLLRMACFRPLPCDHPNFSGSNRYLDYSLVGNDWVLHLSGRYRDPGDTQPTAAAPAPTPTMPLRTGYRFWDVDNDGDGVSDSIWIDPGLPVCTAPDGRRYKRLAAILIKDLDSRINVNVHGNTQQWASNIITNQHRASYRITAAATNPTFAGQAPGMAATITLPRGLGYGPAEIDFQNIFLSSPDNSLAIYKTLIYGRYNRSGEPASTTDVGYSGVPGYSGEELVSRMRQLGIPITDHRGETSAYAEPAGCLGPGDGGP